MVNFLHTRRFSMQFWRLVMNWQTRQDLFCFQIVCASKQFSWRSFPLNYRSDSDVSSCMFAPGYCRNLTGPESNLWSISQVDSFVEICFCTCNNLCLDQWPNLAATVLLVEERLLSLQKLSSKGAPGCFQQRAHDTWPLWEWHSKDAGSCPWI